MPSGSPSHSEVLWKKLTFPCLKRLNKNTYTFNVWRTVVACCLNWNIIIFLKVNPSVTSRKEFPEIKTLASLFVTAANKVAMHPNYRNLLFQAFTWWEWFWPIILIWFVTPATVSTTFILAKATSVTTAANAIIVTPSTIIKPKQCKQLIRFLSFNQYHIPTTTLEQYLERSSIIHYG